MSPLSWTVRQLLAFWAGAFGIAALLWLIDRRIQAEPLKVFWILPARNLVQGLWLAGCAFFRARPFEATAVLAVPVVTFLVTAVWLAGRIAQC